MATIAKDDQIFTVMVRFGVDQKDQQELIDAAIEAAPFFADLPGFVSQTIHKSHDGTTVVSYLQWRSREDHEACMNNPAVLASGQRLIKLIESGRAKMMVQPFDVVYSAEF